MIGEKSYLKKVNFAEVQLKHFFCIYSSHDMVWTEEKTEIFKNNYENYDKKHVRHCDIRFKTVYLKLYIRISNRKFEGGASR